MEEERTKKKREKLKAAFKVSKAKVKLWEEKFEGELGRRPTKEERKQAPENVAVAYKHIWKIQAYFDQEEKDKQAEKQKDGNGNGIEQGQNCESVVFLEDVKENLTGGGHLATSRDGSEISSKVA
jgi:hypothetical protein